MFKAKFISIGSVGKAVKDGHGYSNRQVSFVKIDPFNSDDIKALEYAAKCWENDKFALNIYHAACAIKNKSKYYMDHDIYALTSQKSDFENLDGDKILGLVHTSPYIDKTTLIEHLQIKPAFVYDSIPEYKGVGTGILNSLKLLADKISSFSASEQSVKNFYTKNGFVKQAGLSKYYVWEKQK